ncbi:MAG: hypothetical protein PVG23_03600 [Nitrosopumilaceae archaeon]
MSDQEQKVSNWWYLLPIFLSIIGGLIAYFILKDKNSKIAKRCLIIGAIMIFGYSGISTAVGAMIFVLGPPIEEGLKETLAPASIKIIGYDTRDLISLESHDGHNMIENIAFVDDSKKSIREDIAVYIKNESIREVLIDRIELDDRRHLYRIYPDEDALPRTFTMIESCSENSCFSPYEIPRIDAGKTNTLLIKTFDEYSDGEVLPLKITTESGEVFIGTITIGQKTN